MKRKRELETSRDNAITRNLELSSATSTTHSSKEASSSPATAPSVKVFPFFRLPRELRDEIHYLNALEADIVCYDIDLRALGQPRKVAYVGMRPSGALHMSQFEDEYVAAVGLRIRALMTGGDRNKLKIAGPGPSDSKMGLRDIRFEASTAERADGTVIRNLHALEVFIPFIPFCKEREIGVLVTFRFPDKDELGPRSWFGCDWHVEQAGDKLVLVFPSKNDTVAQQILSVAKGVNWKGAMREYMIWKRYIAQYTHDRAVGDPHSPTKRSPPSWTAG